MNARDRMIRKTLRFLARLIGIPGEEFDREEQRIKRLTPEQRKAELNETLERMKLK